MTNDNSITLSDLIGKTIIGWLYYNPSYAPLYSQNSTTPTPNRKCYVYPRYLLTEGKAILISSKELFPEVGRIQISLTEGMTSEEVYDQLGPLVQIQINKTPIAQIDRTNRYELRYNPAFGKSSSEIWIERFTGKGFYQIIDVNNDITYIMDHRKFPYDENIYTTNILLKLIDGSYYGPFKYTKDSEMVSLQSDMSEQYYIANYPEAKSNCIIIDDYEDKGQFSFIGKTDVPSAIEQKDRYDWMDDEQIILQYTKMLQKDTSNTYTKAECTRLRESISKLNRCKKGSSVEMNQERFNRMIEIIKQFDSTSESVNDIAKILLENHEVKEKIAEVVVKKHYNTIESIVKGSTEYTATIAKAQEEADKIIAEAKEERDKAIQIREEAERDNHTSAEKIDEEISKKKAELENIDREIVKICEKYNIATSYEKIKLEYEVEKTIQERQRIDWEEQNSKQKKINHDLKQNFHNILNEFGNAERVAAEQLKDSYLSDVMRSLDYDMENKKDIKPFNNELIREKLSREEIIDSIKTYISDRAGRDVTFNEVANYLICITQGFITTFAGNPGTGKTSLCHILANAIGLDQKDESMRRYIELSVERGWTSHKDYIGYYNPLNKQIEKSNLEMYHAIELLSNETDDGEHAPYVVLLDEANLSPIEHYWAPFLKLCDFDTSDDRKINLGGKYTMHIPEHLRFLATVNFDHTTEELSPRFLDRSFIITLNPDAAISDIDSYNLVNEEKVISFDNLKEAFMANEEEQIDDDISQKWSAICAVFQRNHMSIMPRNQKMVQNYCMAACACMIMDTPTTKYAPLDYALAQKILPTVSGMGEDYRNLIDQLIEECADMNLSKYHLERMKKGAEDMGFYQFFNR